MFDQTEDEDDGLPKVAKPLPRALREKMQDHSDPPFVSLRFSAIGAEGWPDPPPQSLSSPVGAQTWLNPTDRTVRFVCHLGVIPRLQVHFERRCVPPELQIPDALAFKWLGRHRPLRAEYCRISVEVGPGEKITLPAELGRGVRQIENGQVVSGLAHMLVLEGELSPPPLHPALDPEPEVRAPKRAASKRRTS